MTTEKTESSPHRPGVLSLHIKERTALYAAYMPFCRNGGIFIPTEKPFQMGEEVFLLLSLMTEPEKHAIQGKVAWITPAHAAEKRVQGVGVAFATSDAARAAKIKIENLLVGSQNSTRPTHTL